MPFKKGQPKVEGSGIKKGQTHTITKMFKQAVLNVFHDIGGEEHLAKWAKQQPTEFYKIAARLIPTELTGSGENGVIEIMHSIAPSLLDRENNSVKEKESSYSYNPNNDL